MSRPYTPAWWAAMALATVAASVAIYCQPAQADEWTGKDKAQHAQAGALIGGIAAAAARSPTVGCLMVAGAGRDRGGAVNHAEERIPPEEVPYLNPWSN